MNITTHKHVISLSGKWRAQSLDGKYQVQAEVPGSLLWDLEKQGLFGEHDAFWRENNRQVLEVADRDFIFKHEFTLSSDFTQLSKHQSLWLEADGLDTLTQISLNGKILAKTDNMHRRYTFDISTFLQAGKNRIEILFFNSLAASRQAHARRPLWGTKDAYTGGNHLRKNFCSFGWDWGPMIPDLGVWRDIRIVKYGGAKLLSSHLTQKKKKNAVELTVIPEVERLTQDQNLYAEVIVQDPSGKELVRLHGDLSKNKSIQYLVEKPELWWPNGLGKQLLYQITTILQDAEKKELDRQVHKIGLRELFVERKKDKWGETFQFNINGNAVFARGADYIPEDIYLARMNREKTKKLLEDCALANFNCIRVWGGAVYPGADFFELCDELGLMVWMDMMFACALYDVNNPAFYSNITEELRDNLTRIRHHASLGLICGNNEMEWGFETWDFPRTKENRAEYLKQYEFLFPQIHAEVCPELTYWPASPSSGGSFEDPNGEAKGDAHYWAVWHGNKPFSDYRNTYFRFMSEFGFESFPSLKTVESFTLPEDRNLFSPVMEDHQRCNGGNEKIFNYVAQNLRFPKDFESAIYLSQVNQAEAMRYGTEHWRRNRPRCMGAVYWQLNDNWPVASWASIDYFGRWKALHYRAKHFFHNILVSCEETGHKAKIHLSNESLEKVSGELTWKLIHVSGKLIKKGNKKTSLSALSSKELVSLDFSKELKNNHDREHVLAFSFATKKEIFDGTCLFLPTKKISLLEPKIEVKWSESPTQFVLELSAKAYARYVELDLKKEDVLFSDNYFDMVPGKIYKVTIEKRKGINLELLKRELKIKSVFDTYL